MPKESEMMSFAVTQEQRMFSLRLDKHQAQPLEIIYSLRFFICMTKTVHLSCQSICSITGIMRIMHCKI